MTATPTLPQSIGQAESALRALLGSVLTKARTTFLQWVTLSLIARGASAVLQKDLVRQVAGARKVDEATVVATLDELIALGFIVVQPGDPTRIELTAAGNAHFHALRQSIDTVTDRLYGDLSMDELTTTRRVLGIVTERANVEMGR